MLVCTGCRGEYPDGGDCPQPRCRTGSATRIPSWIGRVIDDRYEIVSLLGAGSMSTVWLAVHCHTQRTVAIKVLEPKRGPSAGDVFANELRATALAGSAHTVAVLEGGALDERRYYLAVELVEGRSLRDELDSLRGRPWHFPFRTAVDIADQVAMSLACAHRLGITHLDLKPSNIMLEGDDAERVNVKLLDFGVAAIAGVDRSLLLGGEGRTAGTPAFIAPEQLLAGGTVDGRADLYSLGVILYEMLTGELPFSDSDPVAQARARLERSPRPCRVLRPDLPQELTSLVDRLLEREPERRPASADAVRLVLQSVRRWRPTSILELATARSRPGARRRARQVSLVAAALAVAIAGAAGVWFWSAPQPQVAQATAPEPEALTLPGEPSAAATTAAAP